MERCGAVSEEKVQEWFTPPLTHGRQIYQELTKPLTHGRQIYQ